MCNVFKMIFKGEGETILTKKHNGNQDSENVIQ